MFKKHKVKNKERPSINNKEDLIKLDAYEYESDNDMYNDDIGLGDYMDY